MKTFYEVIGNELLQDPITRKLRKSQLSFLFTIYCLD